ncbi:MAG TPA: hypothetical protein PLU10_12735 [Chitinophagaceae bacterium]|nr:hypothetical protein [Chitinophagaceae bacterium]
MKQLKWMAMIVFLSSLLACDKKKTDSGTTQLTTIQKLQNKWKIKHVIDYNYTTPPTNDTIVVGGANDYIEFKADNKAYEYFGGFYDTVTYSLISDTQLQFDGDLFTINTLNSSDFKFTYQGNTGSYVYDNVVTLYK